MNEFSGVVEILWIIMITLYCVIFILCKKISHLLLFSIRASIFTLPLSVCTWFVENHSMPIDFADHVSWQPIFQIIFREVAMTSSTELN